MLIISYENMKSWYFIKIFSISISCWSFLIKAKKGKEGRIQFLYNYLSSVCWVSGRDYNSACDPSRMFPVLVYPYLDIRTSNNPNSIALDDIFRQVCTEECRISLANFAFDPLIPIFYPIYNRSLQEQINKRDHIFNMETKIRLHDLRIFICQKRKRGHYITKMVYNS